MWDSRIDTIHQDGIRWGRGNPEGRRRGEQPRNICHSGRSGVEPPEEPERCSRHAFVSRTAPLHQGSGIEFCGGMIVNARHRVGSRAMAVFGAVGLKSTSPFEQEDMLSTCLSHMRGVGVQDMMTVSTFGPSTFSSTRNDGRNVRRNSGQCWRSWRLGNAKYQWQCWQCARTSRITRVARQNNRGKPRHRSVGSSVWAFDLGTTHSRGPDARGWAAVEA